MLLTANVCAQPRQLCPPLPPRPPLPDEQDDKYRLSADRLIGSDSEVTVIEGNAVVTSQGRRVGADRITVDQLDNRATAEGRATFDSVDYAVSADFLTFNLDNDDAIFENATFLQLSNALQGRAARIDREGQARTHLFSASVSTCPPEQQDWVVSAERIRLDHETQQGTAHDAVLRFKGLPLFYTPWFRFPIGDARQSGFLLPSLNFSDSSGTEIALPWYWNIAPQADATFTPRYMSSRGTQLQNELRLLTRQGSWQLDSEYLDDRKFGDQRSFARLTHGGTIGSRWTTVIDAATVSDADYFDDLGNSLSVAGITHLERRGELVYYADAYSLQTTVQAFQTVDPDIPAASRPYERAPQLVLRTAPGIQDEVDYGLTAEAVRFDRRESLTGQRLDLRPYLSFPMGGAAWFFAPTLELRHTQYDLDNAAPGLPGSPARTLPIVSLDGGLFFERDAGSLLQTLEPRLYYLHVPFEEQSELPVFDSGEYTFSFAQLFRSNRFSGADRVGDADQLSVALSSRFLDPGSGIERYSLGIGQILYFRDRAVVLPGAVVDTRERSDTIVQGSAALSETLSVDAALQYDPDTNETDKSVLQVQYRDAAEHVAAIAYRQRRAELLEQVDLSFKWQLTPSWSVLGRWNQSLTEDRLLEGFAGFEYESCCWLLRTVARERVRDEGKGTEQSIFLQLALKGLTSIGSAAGTLLESGILGYRESEDYR